MYFLRDIKSKDVHTSAVSFKQKSLMHYVHLSIHFVSIFQHLDAGAEGAGQNLMSPGSCLQEFRSIPFIECHGGHGRCNYFSTAVSYWLATVENRDMFRKPRPETRKGKMIKPRISRCAVCQRKPPDYASEPSPPSPRTNFGFF